MVGVWVGGWEERGVFFKKGVEKAAGSMVGGTDACRRWHSTC
jgi:hypothetical protein